MDILSFPSNFIFHKLTLHNVFYVRTTFPMRPCFSSAHCQGPVRCAVAYGAATVG